MRQVDVLQDLLANVLQQDLPQPQEQSHAASVVSAPLQETSKEFALLRLTVFLPALDEAHELAIEFSTVDVSPELNHLLCTCSSTRKTFKVISRVDLVKLVSMSTT